MRLVEYDIVSCVHYAIRIVMDGRDNLYCVLLLMVTYNCDSMRSHVEYFLVVLYVVHVDSFSNVSGYVNISRLLKCWR